MASSATRGTARLPLLLPLLACLYLPFIGGGFLTDDFAHIERLGHIKGLTRLIDAPDAFQFYRPVTQSSLALDLAVHGRQAARFRALNVVLDGAVIGLAFIVARVVLTSPLAAGLATLTFALTPKADPIAGLWISARAELLMAVFSQPRSWPGSSGLETAGRGGRSPLQARTSSRS